MSDQPSAYPPPPPPAEAPSPVYQGPSQALPVYQPPQPAYQPPPPPMYQPPASGYQPPAPPGYQWAPGQMPVNPAAATLGSAGLLLNQFSGYAAVSIAIGLASIIVPFTVGYYFYFLPIIGALNGWRAITRGRVIGGAVGIGVNILGGLVSLVFFTSSR